VRAVATVVAFVGYPASGKSEAARMAAELGIPVVCMGDVVRAEAQSQGLEPRDDVLGALASEMRKIEGMDAIARRCLALVEEKLSQNELVVVDGIRGIAEVQFFRQELGTQFRLVHIHSPFELRLVRNLARGRSDALSTREQLEGRDERERSWGLDEAIETADESIANEGSLESFKERVRGVLVG